MKFSKLYILFVLIMASVSAQERPNIVYIICDDLGYGDVQALNRENGKIPTPQMDKIARAGMTFTDAHSGSSVCTPSRYGVLTGRYAWRSRLQEGVLRGGDEHEPLIADQRLTVPAMLKKEGYHTAAMGKWHLGFNFEDENGEPYVLYEGKKLLNAPIGATVPDGPITRGFESYIGFHHSATMETVIKNNKVIDHMPPIRMLQFLGDHATHYIAEEATKKEPFFLYLALNSPHSPVVPSEEWQGKSGMGAYADFVMETDDVVGRVMKALEENGIAENTLVFFTSDNGCSYPVAKGQKLEKEYGHFPSAQFRGSKSDIWEGGHRVPFIVKWPGKIEANATNDELICLTSLMATCADITGTSIPEEAAEDSYSILPLLTNKRAKSEYEYVVHHSINGKFSIRNRKWKLELTPGSGGWTAPNDKKAREMGLPEIQLYNMKKDERETYNVYAQHPRVVKKLTTELKEIVENGRTTDGKLQANDVPVDIFKVGK
ncbi:sulfatase family protein [Arenibacter palladensis]|uniref:sulfatase family protein n=1 Tax=Arenibacter palladensis TaxID=237373 RepID=UPI0026E15E32|nr:arylsulfatase [Arenibacter palladensis]MDO6603843.1 arylsulfatase [Arenibacter palladensis]